MKYSVNVSIEASNEKEAIEIANKAFGIKDEIKSVKDEKPYDRLKALDNFNNKIRQENIKKANIEKANVAIAQAKIKALEPRIKTLLETAKKCNNIPGISEFFSSEDQWSYYKPGVNKGKHIIKIKDDNYSFSDYSYYFLRLYSRDEYYLKTYNSYEYRPCFSYELYTDKKGEITFKNDEKSDNLEVLNLFLDNYESFEKDFYDCIDKALNK